MKRVLASFALLLLCLGSSHSVAQDAAAAPGRIKAISDLAERKVTLSLTDSTVRDALKSLFDTVKVNRCIVLDAAGRGLLSFSVKDVPFEGALVSILHGTRRNRYSFQDVTGTLLILPETPVDRASVRVTLDVQNADSRYVIQALMRAVHANYTLDQTVSGNISLDLDNVQFDHALEKVLSAMKATATIDPEGNAYRIHSK